MAQFLQYFGLFCLILLVGYAILRLIYGKKWERKVAWVILVGPGLMGASKKLADELPNKVKKETLAEVATYAFMRLTRIGLVGLAIALIPIALLWIQNNKITEQNYLIESQRRSSLVLLMNNVLTDLSAEIEKQRTELDSVALAKQNSIGYRLSQPLIRRIASLSQGLLPYRFLVNGKLTEKEYSIERGQLLLALVNSSLDSLSLKGIISSTKFEAAYLEDADLSEADLGGANLRSADLYLADLSLADLRRADLYRANLSWAFLTWTNLSGARLSGTNLSRAYLGSANLSGADLSGANLSGANLSGANLSGANLSGANLNRVDLGKVQSLFDTRGLNPTLKKQLEKKKPCLFTEDGCY